MTVAQRPLAGLDDGQRETAMRRWAVLRPHVEDGVLLAVAAREAGLPLRTVQRWLARYRASGLVGLARTARADSGQRRVPAELVRLVEGLALSRPRRSVASIARRAARAATEQGWPVPSYSTVHAIVADLDPHLLTLAHDGPVALRDRYELVYRRQAQRPNMIWQADHTELDLLVVDARARGQKLGRPTVMTPDKIRMASELVGKESVAAIARLLGVNRVTIYAYVPELQNRHRTALPRARAHRNDQPR